MKNPISTFKFQIKSAIENDTLGHAYLFTGANLEKLNRSALDIIYEIENINEDELLLKRLADGNYSDLLKIGNEDKSIKINDIRKISSFLQMKTVEGTYRIVLISQANNMTIEAQNALLKILEEPYENSLIILLAEVVDAFLPTVLSRVQIIRVNQTEEFSMSIIPFEDKEMIAQHIQRILLLGDVNSIFMLSDLVTSKKNRQITEKYLNYLYSVFFELLHKKLVAQMYNGEDDLYQKISTQLTPHILNQILSTILGTVKQIKQNSALNLAVQAMLIKIQEDYNAENSRNTI